MIGLKRAGMVGVALMLAGGLLSGCSTFGGGDDSQSIAANAQPDQLTPVTDSSVSSNSLPPIGGTDGQVQVANAGPGGQALPPPGAPNAGGPALAGNASGQPGSPFVSLNDVNSAPGGTARNLSGGLSVDKLLGGWTVTSGATQCRLNLTYTAKDGTSRYRASAPSCAMSALASVTSWQLSGTQVQLFNDSNALVGALLLSGNRFLGTLYGGQAISMVG